MWRLLALGLVLSVAPIAPRAALALTPQEAILRAKPAAALIEALYSGRKSLPVEAQVKFRYRRPPKPSTPLSSFEKHAVTARIGPPVRDAMLQNMPVNALP
jgi:hypothetical protein